MRFHPCKWMDLYDLGWAYAVGDDQEGLWLWTREELAMDKRTELALLPFKR